MKNIELRNYHRKKMEKLVLLPPEFEEIEFFKILFE